MSKLAGAYVLSMVAQAIPSATGLPEITGFGASAAAFGILVWMLIQERSERERQRAEFVSELREHRAAVVSLEKAMNALTSELRDRD